MLYIPAEMYGDQQRRAEERRITIIVTSGVLQQAEGLTGNPAGKHEDAPLAVV